MPSSHSALRHSLSPALIAELHPERNGSLDITAISGGSRRRLWWRCSRGHEWPARVDLRSAGYGCPYCAGRLAAPETSLAGVAPAVAAQWHPVRNGERTPETTMPGSELPAWWRCEQGHEWRAAPADRVARNTACPYCAGKRAYPGRSLADLHPQLTAELHPARNEGLDPSAVLPHSPRRVWWRCSEGHEWQAMVKQRVKVRTGCPVCASLGHRGIPLAEIRPDLIAEWDRRLNGGPPGDIVAGSHRRCWWRCAADASHLWRAAVRNRVRHRSGCPYCAHKRPTHTTCLAAVAPALAADWHPEHNEGMSPSDILPYSRQTVWWRCAEGHEWQARVANRMRGTGCPYCRERRRT